MGSNLLGIDLGTSGVKAAVFDAGGALLGSHHHAHVELPGAEQDPRTWWDGACDVIRGALAKANLTGDDVATVGVCGFHHCPVLLDANGEPARPAMLLHDPRLHASRESLEASGALKQIHERTRSMVSAGHFPPIYHHIREHDADALRRARWIVLCKDYLRYRLTGAIATDPCDATGTNLIEPGETTWSPRLCALLGVDPDCLPPIQPSAAVAGDVTTDAARATGLRAGTPVAVGGGDSHCGLLGLGCVAPGDTGMLLGTNSTLRTVFDRFVADPQCRTWVQRHVTETGYTMSASTMAGSSVLAWLKGLVGGGDFDALVAMANDAPPGADGVRFVPFIHGERCPFYDPTATGGFRGLRAHHTRAHLARAAMEGVAWQIVNCFTVLRDVAASEGLTIDEIRVGGGGARFVPWLRIIAANLGAPLKTTNVTETGCFGAALLGGVAVGAFTDAPAAVAATVRVTQTYEPGDDVYANVRADLTEAAGGLS